MRATFVIALLFSVLFAYEDVDAKTFAKLLKQKDVVVLDVRTPQEYMQGHIKGANLIPVQVFQYLRLGGKGIRDKKVLVYCRSGNRSVSASKWLESWGVKSVYNLKRGILEWKALGYPLER
ncbi:MAG: rhodanese-like domain-containing protein [Epsilonproteobacteria bacterium]|nr:rhodanese-like domain-containing protein [Campylobacterota bacterium]NPA64512.1 rhodanese-like domain-containing protein [Campylobacterota bacterium]